jgi:hypothetical protein
MPKRKAKGKTAKHHIYHHIKRNAGFVTMLLLIIAILMAGLFAGSLFGPKFNKSSTGPNKFSQYTCCDTGDGASCQPVREKNIIWKGTNAQPEEYGLIKSGIALTEGSGHLAELETTTTGERVFVNTSDTSADYSSTPGCEKGKDLVFGGSSCRGIENDSIIYVCTSECPGTVGTGHFDAYFRLSEMPDPGIPDAVSNCTKPDGTQGQVMSGPTIVFNQENGKDNLQLRTFDVERKPINTPWLSPYCKPAVYLYPEKTSFINVKVNSSEPFTFTDPHYPPGGWTVLADPSGIINFQNKFYDYLYYETRVSDLTVTVPEEGFVVEKTELPKLLSKILPKLGLNTKESKQFSQYWLGALPDSPYYFVGIVPQEEIEKASTLSISPGPKSLIRVTLYFETLNETIETKEPIISTPVRGGFTVVEWGGIFKRHGNQKFSCFE